MKTIELHSNKIHIEPVVNNGFIETDAQHKMELSDRPVWWNMDGFTERPTNPGAFMIYRDDTLYVIKRLSLWRRLLNGLKTYTQSIK